MADLAVHWFRKGLRLHDNPALLKALEQVNGKDLELRPIFILDPKIAKTLKVGPNRWRFLLQALNDLNKSLKSLGSTLFVFRGSPEEVFSHIFKSWNVKVLTFESDIEPYSVERDSKVEEIAKKFHVKVVQLSGHTIFNPNLIIKKNGGKAPLRYQQFVSVFESLGSPPPVQSSPILKEAHKLSIELDDKYLVPSLEELGVKEEDLGPCLYPGGESEALERMERYLKKEEWIRKFEKPNTYPNSLEPSTTVLSPYLKFGCLSPRLFYHRLKEILKKGPHSKPPVSLIGQLLWREFYYAVAADTPNFHKMVGNSVCLQIDWDTNESYFQAWAFGKTGYPFIDAIMRQLRQEGWIHHLARHAVACFLTRGDLYLNWEKGQEVFEELLLDQDYALNAGNWMWLSASAFFHQFYRVYSPVAFGQKTDKNGDYIRKYVPEVSKLSGEFIYKPWLAPVSVQRTANCVLGKDYPHRIVIHETIHKKNIERMSRAYKANKKEVNKRSGEEKCGTNIKKRR